MCICLCTIETEAFFFFTRNNILFKQHFLWLYRWKGYDAERYSVNYCFMFFTMQVQNIPPILQVRCIHNHMCHTHCSGVTVLQCTCFSFIFRCLQMYWKLFSKRWYWHREMQLTSHWHWPASAFKPLCLTQCSGRGLTLLGWMVRTFEFFHLKHLNFFSQLHDIDHSFTGEINWDTFSESFKTENRIPFAVVTCSSCNQQYKDCVGFTGNGRRGEYPRYYCDGIPGHCPECQYWNQ